ncbi:MAG: KEOPS complex kinase/ATPase Bud32 [Thaumarchaeota archaeon]|nr:KEOPS complex kinase/ATPase Bud32 [Nitrososphaerota archaeon]RNJ71873.1 MAG: Kae1-associated serine/threonine protein kinase [Thaumarchaeota archaeon S14]RNJ72883.1 MAG: Kae1-associated serine/threonine protein kinase [Thaumarchaeota archaeon S13]MDD9810050.1 KEOPS complex kinase/ATPase Bud32 [Nitrososphaerota archaeon]MDD9813046.1 KEOPS complex kinase/ATPase Bud32 [Nitrososphaerota archaeon]
MRLLCRGAEADIYLGERSGREAVIKVRRARAYIDASLDARLRHARTIREAQMISAVKALGVPAPLVLDVDVRRHTIAMQRIRGTVVGTMRSSRLAAACAGIGRIAARLHRGGIVHGDMTTSNFVASRGRLFVLDLGLSSRTRRDEDCAVDLRLFKETLNSAHAADARESWRSFASAYAPALGRQRFARVSRTLADIEARGRYATVT